MKFLEVQPQAGEECLINLAHIVRVNKQGNTSIVELIGSKTMALKEDYREFVKRCIALENEKELVDLRAIDKTLQTRLDTKFDAYVDKHLSVDGEV